MVRDRWKAGEARLLPAVERGSPAGGWEERYSVEGLRRDGRYGRLQRSLYGATQAEALEKLRQAQAGAAVKATAKPSTSGALTVASWLTTWLAEKEAEREYQTHRQYESIARLNLIPALGDKPLSELTVADVKRMPESEAEPRALPEAGTWDHGLEVHVRRSVYRRYDPLSIHLTLSCALMRGGLGWRCGSGTMPHSSADRAHSTPEVVVCEDPVALSHLWFRIPFQGVRRQLARCAAADHVTPGAGARAPDDPTNLPSTRRAAHARPSPRIGGITIIC